MKPMALECNIDARGEYPVHRGIFALLKVLLRTTFWMLSTCPYQKQQQLGVAAIVIGGAFSIFEARAGWCVMGHWVSKQDFDASLNAGPTLRLNQTI